MGNVPERIWATEDTENFGEDRFHSTTPMRGLTEYLRADIAAAREAELRAEVERLSGLLDEAREGLDEIIMHTNNSGIEFASVGMRVAERVEDTARATLAKIGGQND